ncbi:alpha/beta fold hydrolase [Microbacterium aquimaris]|uniref:Alpha/beta hydrolase n=1 Tax=Microbacterium aquimaris TaxID=459816 RepID=A0ABU5N7H6_9MICO|nr:alpha/beta hydrolase [Microbacterium aquimaris]MDZ8162041.1 alpha/beta hydrolase [Microbacterium aquimaris]
MTGAPDTAAPLVLAHDIAGSGPLLVLIHGITENRAAWDPIDLTADFEVLRVDVRGHGRSPVQAPFDPLTLAADVHATVEAVRPGVVPIVVGHSMGGVIATAYGSKYPAAAIINIDQALALGDMQKQVKSMEPLLKSPLFPVLVAQLFRSMKGVLPPEENKRLKKMRTPRREVVLGVWEPMLTQTPEELADTVDETVAVPEDVPYLVIAGLDPGPEYGEWLRGRIPNLTYEVWQKTHYPHLVEPERFVARVKEFAAAAGE